MYSFSEELMKLGAEPSSRVLQFMVCEAADDVAARLSLPRGALVFAVKRLRLAGHEPYAVETSFIPQALAQDLTARAVEEKGLYNAMRECAGVFPRQAEETFRAAALPQESAQHLGEKKSAPAMVVERVAYWKNTPVEYCLSWIRADKFRFTVSLNPPNRAPAAHTGNRTVEIGTDGAGRGRN